MSAPEPHEHELSLAEIEGWAFHSLARSHARRQESVMRQRIRQRALVGASLGVAMSIVLIAVILNEVLR